jgi:hypothetical protein
MAENTRTQVKAAIKRASAIARTNGNKLDRKALDELTDIYKKAAADLREVINSYAEDDGSLKLDVLNELLEQTTARLIQMRGARNLLLDNKIIESAALGLSPFIGAGLSVTQVANDAVQQAHRFIAEDGLQLSDRIWRIDNHAKQVVGDAIQSAVIQGHSASKAALDFISSGQKVPGELADKIKGANGERISRQISNQLINQKGSPYDNALRVFRTEINRAHGNAYQSSAFTHPDVIGTRFLLSPNHPQVDICDMHAKVNRYGLGAGVYPKDKNPWPAHPNTLSYVEAVFSDEVSEEDKLSKTDRVDWLQKQEVTRQNSILGVNKAWMLRDGRLTENAINTPWYVLKKRLENAGVTINPVNLPTATVRERFTPWRENSQQAVWHESSFRENTLLDGAIGRHDHNFKGLIAATGKGAYFMPFTNKIHMSRPMGGGKFTRRDQATWRHEYGHFLDHSMAANYDTSLLFRSAADDFAKPMKKEARQIQELSGFGRRGDKQREILNANTMSLNDITNKMVLSQAPERENILTTLAIDLGMTFDDVKQGLKADTLIESDAVVDKIKMAQILTAAKRKDIYGLMNVLTNGDYKYRSDLYNKGMIGKFSDLIGSASKNKIAGHGPGGLGGHATSYYKTTHDQTTEVFANYTALLGAKEQFWHKLMIYLMPETTRKYREIITYE